MEFLLLDYVDAVEKAPFDIDKNHMKIPTNEERIKVRHVIILSGITWVIFLYLESAVQISMALVVASCFIEGIYRRTIVLSV